MVWDNLTDDTVCPSNLPSNRLLGQRTGNGNLLLLPSQLFRFFKNLTELKNIYQ